MVNSEDAKAALTNAYLTRGNGTLRVALESHFSTSFKSRNGSFASTSGNGISASFFRDGNGRDQSHTATYLLELYDQVIADGQADTASGVAALYQEMIFQLEPVRAFTTQHIAE